jgi:hypothetical protein
MTRDIDLIRELLLKLENLPTRPGGIYLLNPEDDEIQIDGYSNHQIDYHLSLISEAGLIDSGKSSAVMNGYLFSRLSWAGHDFLDSIRDPDVWAKTKRGAEAAGGFTADLLMDLAKGFIKTKIEEHTGVKL